MQYVEFPKVQPRLFEKKEWNSFNSEVQNEFLLNYDRWMRIPSVNSRSHWNFADLLTDLDRIKLYVLKQNLQKR